MEPQITEAVALASTSSPGSDDEPAGVAPTGPLPNIRALERTQQ